VPRSGSYEFKLAAKAVDGLIKDDRELERGEWAWIDRTAEYVAAGVAEKCRWLMIYACCPDCGGIATLYRRRGAGEPKGHDIDAQGNITPSVHHTWKIGDVERCGFHTQPTKLLGFVDRRTMP
jgi:hypothetical protein